MTTALLQASRIGSGEKRHGKLGLGCWVFGGSSWGEQSEADSLGAMATAWEAGVTHWDTAIAYGQGHSEQLCGQFLRGKWEKVFLATKGSPGKKPKSIVKSIHHSLKNLGTDFIDLFYIHYPIKGLDMRPHMELLEKEREKGTIGAIGVSNFSVEQLAQISEAGRIDAHQIGYNLFWRVGEEDVIPYCREKGIALVTYSSLALGILTCKLPANPRFEEGDMRPKTVFFLKNVWPYVHEATERFKALAVRAKMSPHHLAIQWLARQPGVEVVLVGARNARQSMDNAASLQTEGRLPIDPDLLDEATALSAELHRHYPVETNIFQWHP